MLSRFAALPRYPIRAWILGAVLVAMAGRAAADPVRPPAKNHGASHTRGAAPTQIAPAPPALTIPAISSLPTVAVQPTHLNPIEPDYTARLTAALPGSPAEPDVRPGEPTGPLDQAAQVDSYGLLHSPIHPQVPPLISIGDWNFSAAAHVPVTRGHDTGAAISAQHEF